MSEFTTSFINKDLPLFGGPTQSMAGKSAEDSSKLEIFEISFSRPIILLDGNVEDDQLIQDKPLNFYFFKSIL